MRLAQTHIVRILPGNITDMEVQDEGELFKVHMILDDQANKHYVLEKRNGNIVPFTHLEFAIVSRNKIFKCQ